LKSQSTNFNQEPKIMNIKQPQYTFSALALAVVVGLSGPALAQSAAGSSPGASAPSAASKAAQPQVDDKAAREADKKRAELTQDAITALTKTQEALTLLDANKTKEALAALELASGKLELVLARDAKLALAPVDVRVITHDIHANVESVKKAVKLSRELLGDGEVQKARPIVANLASEIVIQTDNLPMATYPAAIKSAARLIDSGKIDNAKAELARALNTLVVTSVAFLCPCYGPKPRQKLKSWPRPTGAMPGRTRSSAPCCRPCARRSRWRRSRVMARRRTSNPSSIR
jgi:hypothetical protein